MVYMASMQVVSCIPQTELTTCPAARLTLFQAFKACAENGTHYLDVTGELPFVAKMIKKYESTAKGSGAMLFPQIGVDSSPADLMAWALAKHNRVHFGGAKTDEVVVSVHKLKYV